MFLRGHLQLCFTSSSLHNFLSKYSIAFYLLPVELLSLIPAPQTSKEKKLSSGCIYVLYEVIIISLQLHNGINYCKNLTAQGPFSKGCNMVEDNQNKNTSSKGTSEVKGIRALPQSNSSFKCWNIYFCLKSSGKVGFKTPSIQILLQQYIKLFAHKKTSRKACQYAQLLLTIGNLVSLATNKSEKIKGLTMKWNGTA